ncbi:hypothetical protein GCM10027082_22570 [Comamonas humi]
MLGLVGLLVVLALVAVLGKKQLQATREIAVQPGGPAVTAGGNVREQSQQIQNQVRQQLESAMQPRPVDAED